MAGHPPSSSLQPSPRRSDLSRQSAAAAEAKAGRRILVRGVNWLGDAVMTTPALLRLREKFPAAHITLLGPEKLADLWKNHPAVDETLSFAAGESVFAIAKKIRQHRFSLSPAGSGDPGEISSNDSHIEPKHPLIHPADTLSPTGGEGRGEGVRCSSHHLEPHGEISPNDSHLEPPNPLVAGPCQDAGNVSPSPRLTGAEGSNGERAGVRCSSHHLEPHGEGAASADKFDLALVLPNSPRSALEVFLAGIPQRLGYARPWRNFFLTQAVPSRAEAVKMHKRSAPEIQRLVTGANPQIGNQKSEIGNPLAHHIHEYLHLVAALGASPEPLAPQLAVTPEELAAAKRKFGLENILQPVFGLNPGAEYGPAKRWPAEKFIAAAREIQQQTNCVWLIFGGKSDQELAGRIAAGIHPPSSILHPQNLAGKTSLRELMALLKLCRVLLTNDTGPMHVAAALGTPVVVPLGSTSPELTGPGLPGDPRHRLLKSDAPCAPCFLRECPIDFRCLTGITVERVVGAVLSAQGR